MPATAHKTIEATIDAGRIVFTGRDPRHRHSLSIACSDARRIWAHALGFARNVDHHQPPAFAARAVALAERARCI